ncbi:MAG: GntR family transcriptional regulator [Dermatophilaceae bacterium]
MAAYRVSRGTARQGLARLEAAGLVTAVHGKGRFVAAPGRPRSARPMSAGYALVRGGRRIGR